MEGFSSNTSRVPTESSEPIVLKAPFKDFKPKGIRRRAFNADQERLKARGQIKMIITNLKHSTRPKDAKTVGKTTYFNTPAEKEEATPTEKDKEKSDLEEGRLPPEEQMAHYRAKYSALLGITEGKRNYRAFVEAEMKKGMDRQ